MTSNDIAYTTILHAARKRLKISCNEYCVADFINWAAFNPKNKSGWCYASQEKIGDTLGLSRKTVNEIVSRLVFLGLVERGEVQPLVRTTFRWMDAVSPQVQNNNITAGNGQKDGQEVGLQGVTEGYSVSNERLQGGVTKGYSESNERLHNNNNTNKDINRDREETATPPATPPVLGVIEKKENGELTAKKDEFYSLLQAYRQNNPGKYPKDLYTQFFNYWTEESADGKMIRKEKEKFFNLGGRLASFWRKCSEDERTKMWKAMINQ